MTDSWKFNGDVGEEREIPALRLIVKSGDTFEVEDAEVSKGFEGQASFEKVNGKASPKAQSTSTSKEGSH